MPDSLKKDTVKGVSWNLLEKVGIQGLRFLLGIVLARLLTPEDYGIVGIMTIFISISMTLVDSGFGIAYVQKKEVDNTDANTIFYFNLTLSLILYLILFFASPLIARFFEIEALKTLVKVMGVIIILNALSIVQVSKLKRNLNFKMNAKINLFATVVSGIVAIIAAYKGLGYWSLVIQAVLNNFLKMLGYWINEKWWPGFVFSFRALKKLFSFGGWYLASSLMHTSFTHVYTFVIGKIYPIAQLGLYTKAKSFQELATTQITGVVGNVSFPVFVKMQGDKDRLVNAMRKFLQFSLLLNIPIVVLLVVLAKPFVMLVLTDKWAPMIPFMQILGLAGIFYPINVINLQALTSQGHSKLKFNLEIVKNSLRVLNILIMINFGLIYIIIGEVINSMLAQIINAYYSRKFFDYGLIKQLKDMYKIILSGVIAGIVGFYISHLLDAYILQITILLPLILGLYLAMLYVWNRKIIKEAIEVKNTIFKG